MGSVFQSSVLPLFLKSILCFRVFSTTGMKSVFFLLAILAVAPMASAYWDGVNDMPPSGRNDIDSDGDGLSDAVDDDDDNDGILDDHDNDDDGDGILDNDEDDDGDGIENDEDDDDDNDGIPDGEEDDDGDGIENDEDNDDDGDGIEDKYDKSVEL